MALERISEHYLVPLHEIVPKEKHDEVLKKYGLDSDNMPRISREDPAAEEIGAKKGDMIKITRDSPTAGKAIFFRTVV